MFRNWRYINDEISDRNALVDSFGPLFRRFCGRIDELRSRIMPMRNANERSPLDAAINGLGERSVERYFAGSAPAVSILPKRESELPLVPGWARNDARFGPGERARRREPRNSTDTPVFVTVLQPVGHEGRPPRIVDVSRSGMKIRMAEFLPPVALVLIRFGALHVVANVHRTGNEPEFLTGVEICQVV
jgi:PilZ domain